MWTKKKGKPFLRLKKSIVIYFSRTESLICVRYYFGMQCWCFHFNSSTQWRQRQANAGSITMNNKRFKRWMRAKKWTISFCKLLLLFTLPALLMISACDTHMYGCVQVARVTRTRDHHSFNILCTIVPISSNLRFCCCCCFLLLFEC